MESGTKPSYDRRLGRWAYCVKWTTCALAQEGRFTQEGSLGLLLPEAAPQGSLGLLHGTEPSPLVGPTP